MVTARYDAKYGGDGVQVKAKASQVLREAEVFVDKVTIDDRIKWLVFCRYVADHPDKHHISVAASRILRYARKLLGADKTLAGWLARRGYKIKSKASTVKLQMALSAWMLWMADEFEAVGD